MDSLVGFVSGFFKLHFSRVGNAELVTLKDSNEVLSIKIEDLGDTVGGGGMGDVYAIKVKNGKGVVEMVAVKAFRANQTQEEINRRLDREARVWRELQHKNILPFYGVAEICNSKNARTRRALLSPWMSNGNIEDYLSKNDVENIDLDLRLNLVRQIARGLSYLHMKGIVHGDLKGNNVLVDDDGNARITDFGRAYMVSSEDCSINLLVGVYWTAPEILENGPISTEPISEGASSEGKRLHLTSHSDVWSFGITVLEVFDGQKRLWGNRPLASQLILHITEGKRPCLQDYPRVASVQGLWECLQECWEKEPDRRLSANDLCSRFEKVHAPLIECRAI